MTMMRIAAAISSMPKVCSQSQRRIHHTAVHHNRHHHHPINGGSRHLDAFAALTRVRTTTFRAISFSSVISPSSNIRIHNQSLYRRHLSSSSSSSSSSVPLTAVTAISSEDEDSIPIPTSMKNAKTLEDVLASIAEQTLAEEERRSLEKPSPWFSLLHYPSRAAWRSSEYLLGNPHDDNAQDSHHPKHSATNRTSLLAQTQFNLLQHSQRTNKQLKRTYKRIMETHKALAMERERERRLAANLSPAVDRGGGRLKSERRQEEPDGSIEDGRGRTVGDWREKNEEAGSEVAPPILCDDPSVALSLSMGLYSSTNAYYHYSNKRGNTIHRNSVDFFGDNKLNINNNDDDDRDINTPAAATTTTTEMNIKSAKSVHKLAKSKDNITSSNDLKPVCYGPEQTMTNVKYRLGPNYSIMKRVLSEVQSLLGGKGRETNNSSSSLSSSDGFRPRRVLDFGSGVGSASAAALDVFGVRRRSSSASSSDQNDGDIGIDWIHSVDASQSMRESTEKVLKSVLEGIPWEDATHSDDSDNNIDAIQSGYDDPSEGEGLEPVKDRRRLERRRKRMEMWEQTWNKRTDARTRLTFGESIADTSFSSSSLSPRRLNEKNKGDNDDDSTSRLPPLPWQQQLDEQRKKIITAKKSPSATFTGYQKSTGSFDLILCSYTLSELPSVPSSLAAAALLWEKLALDGVLVFVEPGTPDGFGTLRSVRSLLLECCPPPEVKERKRKIKRSSATVTDSIESTSGSEDSWPEECHVIAPCTHNGTCPMSRHQKDHVKRNSRFAKYEAAEPIENDDRKSGKEGQNRFEEETVDDNDDDEKECTFQELLDEWDNISVEDKEELKLMLGDGRDLSDEEMKAMLEYMDGMDDDHDDEDDDDDEDQDSDEDEPGEDEELFKDHDEYSENDGDSASQEFYNVNDCKNKPSTKNVSNLEETRVFGTSFCSFVHTFPGGSSRRKGEKFSYLVLQKRAANSDNDDCVSNSSSDTVTEHQLSNSLREIDIVEMLSQSVHHAQQMKKEALQQRLRQKGAAGSVNNGNFHHVSPLHTYHNDKFDEIIQKAVEVEDLFLDSTQDSLGLEMLHGDTRRKGWGRLIRAPLKRKGHVLLDFCSVGCSGGKYAGCSTNESIENQYSSVCIPSDGTKGRIIRQNVSRGWSARTAPGCYSAARKARWGGLWPDLSERVKKETE